MNTPSIKMIKAVSDILECLEQAKNAENVTELLPYMMLIEPLQDGIHSFFEEKIKPIHDAIVKGENTLTEKSEEKKDFDLNAYLMNLNSGKVN